MTTKNRLLAGFIGLCLAAFLLIADVSAFAQDAAAKTKAEIDRLQQSLKDKPIANPDIAEMNSEIDGNLTGAASALAAGKLYLSLEGLGRAEDHMHGARMLDAKAEEIKDSLPAFESEWNKASVQLSALDKAARGKDWSHTTAGVRAISEAAQGRAIPLLEGGRGFATATKPKDGLFYVGQAQGETAFAEFVSKLNVPCKAAPTPLRSLLPELEALQEETNAAFQPPRSIDMHPRFIALNSTIKAARELDSSKAYAGALYQYLEAVR
ncbi:MAG TPA: hypothetical protein VHV32_10770, partial [Candidatus Angelobacter sp.]|nr:hypothetical protein [Candidatus Angelobacter sp.]